GGAERRDLERRGDEGDPEPVLADVGHGERDAVDGDRSLARDEAREVSGQLDDDVVPARPWRTGADRAHAVDVALDDVAAEAGVDAQGPLEVDARAALERAERRVPQGLGHDVRGEGPVAREARDREAHP